MRLFFGFVLIAILLGVAWHFHQDKPWMRDLLSKTGLQPAIIELPLNRVLTDEQGRSIDAVIIGLTGEHVAFLKQPGSQEFVLPLSKLSAEDQNFLEAFEPAGSEIVKRIQRGQTTSQFQDRHAAWNRDIETAKREAENTGLPLCLVVLQSEAETSDEFERNILNSTEFRNWANQNVVLFLHFRNTNSHFKKTELNPAAKTKITDLVKIHGTGLKPPAFILLKPNTTKLGHLLGYRKQSTAVAIEKLEKIISGEAEKSSF